MSSAAQSKKDFRTDKSVSNPGFGFFTLPNSGGLYQHQKSTATPNINVAAAKNNLMNQKTNHHEPNFGNRPDFNVDSHSSGVLRQFGADKTNVGFMAQAQNANGFNKQGQSAYGFSLQAQNNNGIIPQGQNANRFRLQGQNANEFSPQEQIDCGFNSQRQTAYRFSSQAQNTNGFNQQGQHANHLNQERITNGYSTESQNTNRFSSQGQNSNGFITERQNANEFRSHRPIVANGFNPQGQDDFGAQHQNAQVFSSNEHIQSYGTNSCGPKRNGTQVHYREDNTQMQNNIVNTRMLNNHQNVICQKDNCQTCFKNDPNDYCCPRNVNTRRPCCNQRDCDPQYEEILTNKAGIITNGLEMKQKAIVARETRAKGSQNILKDIEKCNDDKENILVCSKNKTNEPTVSDLYEIIKLQNQQLQILQNRVDRLLNVNEAKVNDQCELPKQVLTNGQSDSNLPQTDVNVNCIEHISIGVMTSFELVMSSNYINKRSVTFNPEVIKNQDNRRDECVQTTPSNSDSILLQHGTSPLAESSGNFLDGIARCNKPCDFNGSGSKTPKKLSDDTVPTDDQVTPKMNDLHRKVRSSVQRGDSSPIAEYNDECFDE